ncbi:MAG: hypothetical protein IMZ53_16805 [Thermoplasmata archaeon]|nr:hypothetical protein [Thermoplasmata archaeon]
MKLESTKWEFSLIKMDSIDNLNGHIAGAKFVIGGLPLLLTFGLPVSRKFGSNYLHRPSGIVFGINNKKKGVQFNWTNYAHSQWVLLNLEATPNE